MNTQSLRALALCAPAISLLLAASPAAGDGFITVRVKELGKSGALAASPKQEAVIARSGKTVQVILRMHFRAGPSELAWVVPVPSRPRHIGKARDDVFDRLEELTAPKFYAVEFRGKPFYLACTTCGTPAGSTAATTMLSRVTVEAAGTAGIFQYVVLAAGDAGELTAWLTKHQYAIPPGAGPILKRYVEGGWYWLAMRVRPEVSDRPTLAPHPVTWCYTDDKLVYPLVISQLSAAESNEVVLYVVGRRRYECRNWPNLRGDEITERQGRRALAASADSPSGTNYEDLFRRATRSRGGHLFVTEFSDDWSVFGHAGRPGRIDDALRADLIEAIGDRQVVTRLRAAMTPGAMDRDVVLGPFREGGEVSNEHHVYAAARTRPDGSTAIACLAVCLFIPGGRLLRRPGWRRIGGALAILLAALSLAMI